LAPPDLLDPLVLLAPPALLALPDALVPPDPLELMENREFRELWVHRVQVDIHPGEELGLPFLRLHLQEELGRPFLQPEHLLRILITGMLIILQRL
jgi:hypothetical protein